MTAQDSNLCACLCKGRSHGSSKVATAARDDDGKAAHVEACLHIESFIRHISSSRCCSTVSHRSLSHERMIACWTSYTLLYTTQSLPMDTTELYSGSISLFDDPVRQAIQQGKT